MLNSLQGMITPSCILSLPPLSRRLQIALLSLDIRDSQSHGLALEVNILSPVPVCIGIRCGMERRGYH